MELSLEALGITGKELQERVIDKIVEQIMVDREFGFETGEEYPSNSRFVTKLENRVLEIIDERVKELADTHILPNVAQYIENLTLQETNKWGEAKGQKMTFVEYLVLRAENYLTEQVSYNGKSKAEDSYNWRGYQTRIAFMINEHLSYNIKTAMEQAVKTANTGIAEGLQETVKIKLAEIAQSLKVDIKLKS